VGLSATLVALPGTDGATPGQPVRPTIVLEHGAFADASGWDGVVERLQRALGQVIAPVNYTLPGERREPTSSSSRTSSTSSSPRTCRRPRRGSWPPGIPSWSLVTTEDRNIPVAAQRFMSAQAHARTTEIDASHAVSVPRPDAVARSVEQAARTVR
jgi:pimeloyl-ACP methyl ester carboxylesterase